MRLIQLALLASFIAAGLASTGCATTTTIISEPPGATVFSEKDKKDLGVTPLPYESKMWIWESEKVTLKAAGMQDKSVELKRSEVDWLPMIGGACLSGLCGVTTIIGVVAGLPIIGAAGMKLPAETKVTLDPAGAAVPQTPAALLDKKRQTLALAY